MTAVWFAAGLVAAVIAWVALEPTWRQPLFARANFRGRDVPTAGGVALVVGMLVVAAAAGAIDERGLRTEIVAVLVAVIGFGLLGALDDLAGDNDRKGFRGHLGALVRGELTTGGLKLIGGLAVAACAVAVLGGRPSGVEIVVVAAAANLGNLFDRAPGRVGKVALLAFGALLAGGGADVAGTAVAVGGVAGLLPFDLRERLMLGDAGANAVGAALGVGAVIRSRPGAASWAVAIALVALNLASERVSFSRVIAAVAPLRWFDRLGRLRVDP